MKVKLTTEEIERWRDRVHRRTPSLAVGTERQALKFINDVGFCFAFKALNSELPCLWHAACGQRKPRFPHHTHTDPFLSFVWKMKDVLPAQGKVFYAKIFRKRPTMISMSFFPDFYALSHRTGHKDDYLESNRKETLSDTGREIMDVLRESAPQVTKGLKLALGVSRGDSREFDKAIAELQTKFFIVKVAERYDPFTFEWNTVDKAYPKEVRKARRVDVESARSRILLRYFQNQLVSTVRSIQSVFGWKKQIIYQTMGTLLKDGAITGGITVDGKDGKYYSLVR